MDPFEAIKEGHKILHPLFYKHFFFFRKGPSGQSSGGTYASGAYFRWTRRFEFHFRYSLGLVTYRLGNLSISHDDYMWAVLGRNGGNKYPGFEQDPVQQFRDLRHDLENYCTAFISGSADDFRDVVRRANQRPRGLAALD